MGPQTADMLSFLGYCESGRVFEGFFVVRLA